MNKGKRSFVTATRAAAAPPKERKESSAGNSQHHGSEKSTLSELACIFVMSLPPFTGPYTENADPKRSAPLRPKLPVGPENLDAIVVSVGDHHVAIGQNCDIGGVVQRPTPSPTGAAERCDESTVRAQVLYAMVVEVGDIEIAVRRHGHPARRVEGARLGAGGTDDANDLAVWCEHLDAVVELPCLPQAATKLPLRPNLWMRLLPESVT